MNNSITNVAEVSGLFDSRTTGLTDTVVTAMTEDLTMTKVADKSMWADGNLTYTVTITNANTTLTYDGVTFSDVIDPTLASLVANSVKLNGTDVTYVYDDTTGELTLTVGNITAPGSAVITFEIAKK